MQACGRERVRQYGCDSNNVLTKMIKKLSQRLTLRLTTSQVQALANVAGTGATATEVNRMSVCTQPWVKNIIWILLHCCAVLLALRLYCEPLRSNRSN